MANYLNLVVGGLEDHYQQITAFETNSTRIVHSQPQRRLKGVYFCTLQKMYKLSLNIRVASRWVMMHTLNYKTFVRCCCLE